MQIAEFFASLKIKPDMASIARADRWLKTMEKRINRSAKRMEKNNVLGTAFSTDTKKLNKQLQRSLDRLSKNLVLRITRFHINERGLERALGTAMQRSNTPLPIRRFRIDAASLRRSLELAMAGISPTVRPQVLNRPTRSATGNRRSRGSRSSTFKGWGRSGRFRITPSGVGITAGGVGVFGGFGIAALNRTVRELESLPVALEAVTGSPERARAELEYLNQLGNEVGAPVRTLAPSYTKFLASAQGTKLEPFARSGFRDLTRYGAVMGLDQEAMKGTFRA